MSISDAIKSNEVLKVLTRIDVVPLRHITRLGSVGDSVTEGGYSGSSFVSRIGWLNGEYIIPPSLNFADGGKTSAEILADQIPLAIAARLSHCTTQFGTNDFAQSVPMATLIANAQAIWSALRAAGTEPIHIGLQPVDNQGNYDKACYFDIWSRIYCRDNNILYIDIMPKLSAGGTGGYKPDMGHDSVHPSSVGSKVIAQAVDGQITKPYALTPVLAESDDVFSSFAPTARTLNANGVSFTGGTPPTGYGEEGTGGVLSVEAPDSDGFGSWLRATLTADTAYGFSCTTQTLAGIGWSVGDRIAIAYRVRWVDSNQALTLTANTQGNQTFQTFTMFNEKAGTETGDDMFVYTEGVIASGTSIGFKWVATGTGYFEVNRPTIFNLTKMGL